MADTTSATTRTPGIKIIHAGLFRTATMSMAKAYTILGYSTHHGLHNPRLNGNPYHLIEDAAHSTFPELLGPLPAGCPAGPRPRPVPYRREDWDRLFGNEYDVATDMASPFAEAMIEAYPEAKVVVVQRDFETWWPSFKTECLDGNFKSEAFSQFVLWNVMGTRVSFGAKAMFRAVLRRLDGGSVTTEEARVIYEGYYARIRKLVPEERRLEFHPSQGWGPLCEFLGKEVPLQEDGTVMPFPRINDAEQHQKLLKELVAEMNRALLKALARWLAIGVGISAVAVGVWRAAGSGGR
jgi:hypothetical protein